MRVAIFCPTVSGRGGMETAIMNLMAGLRAIGDEVRLFLFGGSNDAQWLSKVDYTGYGTPAVNRALRMVLYAYGPARSIASWKPDVILCADVTTIRMARFGRKLTGRSKVPIASWVHFPLDHIRMREKLHLADLHLAISPEIADTLREQMPDQADRIFTVFNAVDVEGTALLPRPEDVEFLYIGRLTWDDHKRVNDLLTAAAQLRGAWRLKIVGAAPKHLPEHGPRLKAYAEELGIADRVSWLGWQRDPWAAAGPATALVMPSEREGFPMVLIEAISHGVFCLSSDCRSGPSEIIVPGQNGILFPVGDTETLTTLMQAIVDNPQSLPSQQAIRATAYRYAAPAIAQRAKESLLTVMQAGA